MSLWKGSERILINRLEILREILREILKMEILREKLFLRKRSMSERLSHHFSDILKWREKWPRAQRILFDSNWISLISLFMYEKINMYIPLWATKCISLNNKFDRVAKEQVSEDRFHVKYFIQILRAWISNSIIIFYLIFLFKATGKFRIIRNSKTFRNSRSQMFFKINVLKNFAMFIGKHRVGVFFEQSCRPSSLQLY